MDIKNKKGFVGTDIAISILAIFIFSGLIVSLMYNNFLENTKVKRQTLATIYLTETLENVGRANYDEVTQEKSNYFIPEGLSEDNYSMVITIVESAELFNNDVTKENILKKVTATITYKIGNKEYQYSMERMKGKE